MTLDQLKLNIPATIIAINIEGNTLQRLKALGVSVGMSITLIGISPLNDPLLFLVCDSHLVLRRQLARQIEVSL